ncbi:MAG: diguanylate cyclase response regulator [Gammaproteobacteria bacterium]|nr:MAG: diguanylate cyclase response regulator [Gammaproteobacteria bacterium]
MKVMLVEDDRAVMMVTTAYIKSFGHDVVEAISGEIALELFDLNTIDLVLMDFLLPGIDGVETTRRLRSIYQDEWFPIIFLTSANDDKHLAQGIEAGADDYLHKPITPIVLESKITAIARLVKMQKDLLHASRKMEKLSYLDGLTHIYNRRGFDRAINSEWKRMMRDKNSLAFLMIDVDYFKKFNDHYGHQAGDECLKTIATALEDNLLRPADLVARYGGEEFAVLLPATDDIGALQVAIKLVSAIAQLKIAHSESDVANTVTISIGVAVTSSFDGLTQEDLIKSADEYLYKAKSSGRNQHCSTISSTEKA